MNERTKYIRTRDDKFIFFCATMNHSDFRSFYPKSAGFCIFSENRIDCYGGSLKLGSMSCDSVDATRQVFGIDAVLKNFK